MGIKKLFKELSVLEKNLLDFNTDNALLTPSELFYEWFEIVLEYNVLEPHAMTLSKGNQRNINGCLN